VLRCLRATAGAIALLFLALPSLDAQRQEKKPLTLDEVMRRAHSYVAVYEDHELSSLAAREEYKQEWMKFNEVERDLQPAGQRTLISDYLIFQLPPSEDWFALRNVESVNGTPVADRDVRLKMLFTEARDNVEKLAMAVDRESARFNIGNVSRTVNLPTFALRFLRPVNRKRFNFEKESEERVGELIGVHVIPRPADDLESKFPIRPKT
jgi:hypothetical protein